jgi:hypothetical protein
MTIDQVLQLVVNFISSVGVLPYIGAGVVIMLAVFTVKTLVK